MQVHFSSEDQTCNTPQVVVDRLLAFDERGCSLDPCSNETSIVPARAAWRIERGEDGLARDWFSDHGPVFCNPPYEHLQRWAAKMAREAERRVEIIGLIPARPDTVAFQRYILPTCSAIVFWRGRLEFLIGPSHTAQIDLFPSPPDTDTAVKRESGDGAPFPSCLPYWGPRPRTFLRAFEPEHWGVVCR